MKKIFVVLGIVTVVSTGFLAQAQQQGGMKSCQAEMGRRQQAQNQLNGCIAGWTRNFRPEERDPKDDCAQRLKSFVSAAKSAKKCNADLSRASQPQQQPAGK